MVIIAHRGNVRGPAGAAENTAEHIISALSMGFDVEVDVWMRGGLPFLGHNGPRTPVSNDMLLDGRMWCHAKEPDALDFLLSIGSHCFFHEGDEVTLTSRGIILTLVGRIPIHNSICMLPEKLRVDGLPNCTGICSDHAEKFRDMLNQSGPIPRWPS